MNARINRRIEAIEKALIPKEAPQWLTERMEAKRSMMASFDWLQFDRLCRETFEKSPPRPEVIADLGRYLRWSEQQPRQN